MAAHNQYTTYKQETQQFLYWMIHASNSIINTLPVPRDDFSSSPALNTSGQTTVAGLVAMAELVEKHMKTVPTHILRLLESIIAARVAFHARFQQLTSTSPDAEMEKSNSTHRHFIDALTKVFDLLGGHAWASRRKGNGAKDAEDGKAAEGLDEAFLANKFSPLNLETTANSDASSEASDQESHHSMHSTVTQRRSQRKPGKGKKKRKGKKHKKSQRKPAPAKRADLKDVPLESYRIIDEEESPMIEYLKVAFSVVHAWSALRNYLQTVWRQVAYRGLNSAVAGVLTNMAVSMVKEAETKIFADFPGHYAYNTMIWRIAFGNFQQAQDLFSEFMSDGGSAEGLPQFQETPINFKEFVLANAYEDLFNFIVDYQKTRCGRPTKAMRAEIDKWDPELNLQEASHEQRLKWRRSYTINWLYDLVNVSSSEVLQRARQTAEQHALEDLDWSPRTPREFDRELFGLNEFAAFVTSLAMQRPGTDFGKSILPHHVFQLQCIVDAFTVSRGWILDILGRHIVKPPPGDFRARRDVGLFLDGEFQRKDSGFLASMEILENLLQKDGSPDETATRNKPCHKMMKEVQGVFINWLGLNRRMYEWDDIQPSRFSDSDANGLWEFSPFLCGIGLAEGLGLAYRMSMTLWEHMAEPTLLVHLHNMLAKRGYVAELIGLYDNLQSSFTDTFFANGKVPETDFGYALIERLMQPCPACRVGRRTTRDGAEKGLDLHAHFDIGVNRCFKKKSTLVAYYDAEWDLKRIPNCDINARSWLALMRVLQTKPIVDPVTGKKRLPDTDLIRQLKADCPDIFDEEFMVILTAHWTEQDKREQKRPQTSRLSSKKKPAATPASYAGSPAVQTTREKGKTQSNIRLGQMTDNNDLASLKRDVFDDVFTQLEEKLKSLGNPLYYRVYESLQELQGGHITKRGALVALALTGENEECLLVMAEVLQANIVPHTAYIHWDDLRSESDYECKKPGQPGDPTDAECTLM